MNNKKYFIGVASKDHVMMGVEGGFCQFCHGKHFPIKKLRTGDWIIYYSPNFVYEEKEPCQNFTAIGEVLEGEPYQVEMENDLLAWRRNVIYHYSREVEIKQMINELSFIKNKKYWGAVFRSGFVEIPEDDFDKICEKMFKDFY